MNLQMSINSWIFIRIQSFYYGLGLPIQAFRLIFRHPTLLFWSILPVAITLGLYVWLIRNLQDSTKAYLLQAFVSAGWDPNSWIAGTLIILVKVLLVLVGAMTFSLVASVASAPFNDFLAESAEQWTTPPLPAVPSQPFRAKMRLIVIDLLKTVAGGVAGLAAMIFSWVPVVNLIAVILALLLVSFQFVSYPQTRRGEGLQAGLRFIWKYFYACLGFGLVTAFLFAIPIVSSLSIPLAVVGGTLLVGRAYGAEGTSPPLR